MFCCFVLFIVVLKGLNTDKESKFSDCCNRIRYSDLCEIIAKSKCGTSNVSNSIFNYHFLDSFTMKKPCTISDNIIII